MKFSLLLALPLFTLSTAWSQKVAAPDQVEKVKSALPAAPAAKPKAKHEVLVFSKTNGFRHSSIELGVEAMKLLGEKTGAFNVTATEDDKAFEPDNLKKYDAVIFLNTTGDLFRPKDFKGTPEEKQAMSEREELLKKTLLEFVNSGKGVIGFHSATDTFAGWKEYHDMMGGVFSGHPWHEKIGVKNVDPANVINKSFNQANFDITDEIYQWKPGSFSTDNHRVLLAIDNKTTNMDKKGTNGNDALYPISIARKYGKGRCFYCSLGHREEIYWNPTILQHYLAGIQFVLGDLEAEAAPKNVP